MGSFTVPATPSPATAAADSPESGILARVLVEKEAEKQAKIEALPEAPSPPVDLEGAGEVEKPSPPQEKTDTTFSGASEDEIHVE